MFDTRIEEDFGGVSTFDVGEAVGFSEQRFNDVDVIGRHANGFEEQEDSIVCYAIKRFAEVDEEDVIKFFVFESTIESFVEVIKIVLSGSTSSEAILVVREDGVDGGSNTVSNDRGNNAIVTVIDHKRASVFNVVGVFLPKEVENTAVEVAWGG